MTSQRNGYNAFEYTTSFQAPFSNSILIDGTVQPHSSQRPSQSLHATPPGSDQIKGVGLNTATIFDTDTISPPANHWEAYESDPVWTKNDSKLYVVVYPSDPTSTYFQVDRSKPKVHSLGAGYGIFVEPTKVSKMKFWKEKSEQPTLFTVDGGGPAPGLTTRTGVEWGVNGMLVRFLVDSKKQDVGRVHRVHQVLDQVALGVKSGDERWLREALVALVQAGLVQNFYVEEFIDLMRVVVKEQLLAGASWDRVVTVDYEDYLKKGLNHRIVWARE